jgi:tetratricopeptide (TPR) repeat protein
VRATRDENVLRVNIGDLFFQAGRYDEAMQEFEGVQAASPGAWRVGINIANVETARGRTGPALRALEPVIARLHAEADRTGQPSVDELLYCHELAGDLLHDTGAPAFAAAHYRAALAYAPPTAVPGLRAKLSACEPQPVPAP